MTTFDDREKAYEAKFAHDQELMFKAIARRNKLAGLWAAELMGKTGAEAEEYALEVVKADFREPGDDDIVEKLKADLGDRVDEQTIRAKLADLMAVAKEQVVNEA
ncbi:MAG: DUF1476 domain-containing protein [Alphaproteobacteria bacterium]|nr:MAG: DUF1476 domain-containing protein [Alphaproteobacteria bacterium]